MTAHRPTAHPTKNGATLMFLAPFVTLTLLLTGARDRVTTRLRRDDGAVTLEAAVIASALFLAAVAFVAVIVRAITSRADQIQ